MGSFVLHKSRHMDLWQDMKCMSEDIWYVFLNWMDWWRFGTIIEQHYEPTNIRHRLHFQDQYHNIQQRQLLRQLLCHLLLLLRAVKVTMMIMSARDLKDLNDTRNASTFKDEKQKKILVWISSFDNWQIITYSVS